MQFSPIERALIDETEVLEPLLDRPWPEITDRLARVQPGGYICGVGLYARILEHWFCHFPRERFLILRSEDLYADQQAAADRVFRFVGVPPFELPQQFQANRGSYPPLDPKVYERLDVFFSEANRDLTDLAGDDIRWD